MTPAARISAAIEVLDRILDGQTAEAALTGWARSHRFAGSGDRAALRDLVFDALRCRQSYAALGGSLTGRGLMLGALRDAGADTTALFTGVGHAPAKVEPSETGRIPESLEALDCPAWLAPALQAALGDDFPSVLQSMRRRAPVYLRVNTRKGSVESAVAALSADGIVAVSSGHTKTTLEVTGNTRKIQTSTVYLSGLVELQDAASQAVVAALPLRDGHKVLDYCAGGGGKTLAMADRADIRIWAHDANPRRMSDLPARAARAGVRVEITENPYAASPYDLVLTDVPCSGSGSWRRDPQGKWSLTAARLAELTEVQAAILDRVSEMVSPGGTIAYATCSLLGEENESQIAGFLKRFPGWCQVFAQRFTPLQGGDGFFIALLTRT